MKMTRYLDKTDILSHKNFNVYKTNVLHSGWGKVCHLLEQHHGKPHTLISRNKKNKEKDITSMAKCFNNIITQLSQKCPHWYAFK